MLLRRTNRLLQRLAMILPDLEFPILVFPVIVISLVAATFLFPIGKCSLWQWWLSVVITLGLYFLRTRSLEKGIYVGALFLLALMLLWLIVNITLFGCGFDTVRYHLPAIRMMIDGWNPVWDGTVEGIENWAMIPANGMRSWHIISMAKGVWYFCAAAFFFTHNAINVLSPPGLVVFAGLCFSLRSTFHASGKISFLALVSYLISVVYGLNMVDLVVALSAIGLLCAMYDYLKTSRWHWLRLIVFSFWLGVCKQTAMLQCGVFWGVFIVACLLKEKLNCWKKMVHAGIIILILCMIVGVSPYISSSVNYGHPFYPNYSFDEVRFPVKPITEDFYNCNEDAKCMSHLGRYFNAFISEDLSLRYYRYKTGREDFYPRQQTWYQGKRNGSDGGSPTNIDDKLCFVLIVGMLLVSGRWFITSCLLAGTFIVPSEMVGYLRYVPWLYAVGVFLIDALGEIMTRVLKKWNAVLMITIITLCLCPVLMLVVVNIDHAYALRCCLRYNPPPKLIGPCVDRAMAAGEAFSYDKGHLVFLRKQVSSLRDAEIISLPVENAEYEPYVHKLDRSKLFFGNLFYVFPEYALTDFSMHYTILSLKDRKERLLAYPSFVCKTIFVTLPKFCIKVIAER